MTGQRETTRYATPSLRRTYKDTEWRVTAEPWHERVGFIRRHDAGWTAHTSSYHPLGLWPTKQAAAEVLVKQAGYELELT